MGVLRQLLLTLNRHGRALQGSAAFPPPPELHVPADLKEAIDAEDSAADETGASRENR